MNNNSKQEEPNHNLSLPSCILYSMLWASRVLVVLKFWHSDMSLLNVILSILFYFAIIEIGLTFILCIVRYIPMALKDPTSFIGVNKKELMNKDRDFIDFTIGVSTIAYLLVYFL